LIPHVESNEEWKEAGENGQPAWCYYDNDPENGKKYGKLYNWYAVNDSRGLAPEGYHVPTDDEWTSLVEFLGGKKIGGHKMKSVEGWEDWEDEDGELQNGNGDNSSGFNGLPGGGRFPGGSFIDIIGYGAIVWSATEYDDNDFAWYRLLSAINGRVDRIFFINYNKSTGTSVRCLKDSSDSKWLQAVKSETIKPYIPPGLKLK
jgi:uncharacterized protein (TIGR02145 family)